MIEDRILLVKPTELVRGEWIDINACVLGNRAPMTPEAVEKKWRKLLQQDGCASWPAINGRWEGDRFVILDGRHEYTAALMLGWEKVLVCWIINNVAAEVSRSHPGVS